MHGDRSEIESCTQGPVCLVTLSDEFGSMVVDTAVGTVSSYTSAGCVSPTMVSATSAWASAVRADIRAVHSVSTAMAVCATCSAVGTVCAVSTCCCTCSTVGVVGAVF